MANQAKRMSWFGRVRQRFSAKPAGSSPDPVEMYPLPRLTIVERAPAPLVAGEPRFRWRRHPALLVPAAAPRLDETERWARRLAVKGLYAGHNGTYDEAYSWFVRAVQSHPVDLCAVPGFWQMPRGAILAAADAYLVIGRQREAAMVRARVRTEFRPRNVVAFAPRATPAMDGAERQAK